MRLTQKAHEAVASVLGEGSLAVDATAGNGHDTCFLAGQVGASGHVWALDVQPAAIEATSRKLADAGLVDRVTLLCESHAQMQDCAGMAPAGRVGAVMFNLGYLPGSDRELVTRAESTIPALEQALTLLAPGGCLSVMVYRGHEGGDTEWDAVQRWLADCGADWSLPVSPDGHNGPVLALVGI